MKTWEYEAITEGSQNCDTHLKLAYYPELAEALCKNGLSLPLNVTMKAVREICRLILAERKTTDARRGSELVKQLQASMLERGIYVNPTDVCECYRQYSETYESQRWVENLESWEGRFHIGPVDYIAARIGNGKPS